MAKKQADPFANVREATLAHRAKHGCGAWPYDNGPLLGVIAGGADAKRILELGSALGYTSLNFAHGAPKAKIDTVERDREHVRLARDNIAAAGMDKRITVHEGDFAEVLPKLETGYDVAFFDGHTPVPALHKTLHEIAAYRRRADHRQSQPRRHRQRGPRRPVRRQVLAQRADR